MAYSIKAPRILATSKNYDALLQRYDPTAGDGPWWHDRKNNKHCWNGEITLEVMVEGDVELSHCVEVKFVRHHANYCNIDHRTCTDRDMPDYRAAFKFLSGHIAGFGFASSITPEWSGPPINPRHVVDAWERVEATISRRTRDLSFGSITAQDPAAPVLARALFRTFAVSDQKDVDIDSLKNTATLFADQAAILDACQAEFTRVFGELEERPL